METKETLALADALRELINTYNLESGSNTPDYILADFMLNCLNTFNNATIERGKWYGRERRPYRGDE